MNIGSVSFGSKLTAHQFDDGFSRRLSVKQDTMCCFNNGHGHTSAIGQSFRALCIEHTFRNTLLPRQRLLECESLPYCDAHCAITRQRASAGQHEISKPSEP